MVLLVITFGDATEPAILRPPPPPSAVLPEIVEFEITAPPATRAPAVPPGLAGNPPTELFEMVEYVIVSLPLTLIPPASVMPPDAFVMLLPLIVLEASRTSPPTKAPPPNAEPSAE